jgi:hypothetical protein
MEPNPENMMPEEHLQPPSEITETHMDNPDNKLSETFTIPNDNPEEKEKIPVIDEVANLIMNQKIAEEIKLSDNNDDLIDFSALSIEEIVKKLGFPIFTKEETYPNFSVFIRNKYHKFYAAKNDKLGGCSIIILNGVNIKKEKFGRLLQQLAKLNQIPSRCLMKCRGVVLVEEGQVFLIFDFVCNSYKKILDEKKKIEDNFKFITLFYLIEIIVQCHEKGISLLDIRPSNLIYNGADELRYLISYRKINLYL